MNTSTTSKMTKSTTAAAPAKEVKKSAAAAAPAKTEKKVAAKKEVVAAVAPVVAPVVAAKPVEVAAEVVEITWNEEVKTLQTTVEGQIATLKSVLANLKRLEKRVGKEIKDAKKKRKAVRKENADGTPVVVPFQIPKPVSDELGVFLGKGKNATASRSEVTKFISAYVKQKNLGEGHNIKADASLMKLLGITAADQLTYFNLQKYLNKHYIKEAK
jgi:chromatin remodeling complex protein RSC6